MEQKWKGKGILYVFGPFALYWLISIAAATLAEAAALVVYAVRQMPELGSSASIEQYMLDNFDTLYKLVLSRSVELSAFTAAVTLIFSGIVFATDRKKVAEVPVSSMEKPAVWKYGVLVVFGLAVCIGLNNLINMFGLVFYSEAYQETSAVFYSAGFGVQICCLGILIPISEEMIYRGVIFWRYRRIAGFYTAAVNSTAFFALAHGNVVQFLYAFALGMFLAYVYEKYHTIKAPICLHIVVNLTSLVVTKVDGFSWMFMDFARLCIVTVGCAFIGACAFVWIQRSGAAPEEPDEKEDSGITPDMFR